MKLYKFYDRIINMALVPWLLVQATSYELVKNKIETLFDESNNSLNFSELITLATDF